MKRPLDDEKDDLGERIALSCYKKFNEFSSRGKPSSNEWTHLAAFVLLDQNNQIDILSIGTGTKCLGGQKEERGINGCLLHDSHAEVIARRSLIRLLYEDILQQRNNSILIKLNSNEFVWNESYKIYLFVSYPPCGSAAFLSDPIKRLKFEHKSLNNSDDLYFKPGKGFQTTSLSCSNKINRWIAQGLQGSLLDQIIIKPIQLSGLIIHSNTDLSSIFPNTLVRSIDQPWEYGPFSTQRIRPCSMSISWWKYLDLSSTIVTVDGHLLGQIKKFRHQQKYASPIAKSSLFKLYLQILHHLPPTTTYAQAKELSKNQLTKTFFENNPQWLRTDPNFFYSFSIQLSKT